MKRVCLLTGASGLLGSAFIESYAGRYQIVALHHRNAVAFATQDQEFVDPLCPSREIARNRDAVYSLQADISKPFEIDRVISDVVSRFERVDLLINGAAIRSCASLLAPGSLDPAEVFWQVNVLAPLRLAVGLAQRFWRYDPNGNLRSNRNIVNLSSTAGMFVYPDLGQGLYAASKAALNHLTYHLASEFWDIGIRVNALAPDMFPERISIETVVNSIVDLDEAEQTGHVVELCRQGQ